MSKIPIVLFVVQKFKLILLASSILLAQQTVSKEVWINSFNGKGLSEWMRIAGDPKFYVSDNCIVGEAASGNDTNSVL